MIQNWLKPLAPAIVESVAQLSEAALGKHIQLHTGDLPDLKKIKIAILGVQEKEANDIRAYLYKTVFSFSDNSIIDLGNLRKPDPSFLIPVVYELLSGKIVPIIIGAPDGLARSQFLAYQNAKALVNMAIVDERLRYGAPDDVYTPMLSPRHPLLFHLALVGYQTHHMPADISRFLEKNHFDQLRLGKSRAAIEETEPVLRDADLLAFHLGALKQSEAPGVSEPSPSGYIWEEACQLCRYAGMSDKLSSFGIYGYQRDTDRDGLTAHGAAQMVWYFMEGFYNRKNDYPASTTGLTEYIVDFRQINHQLTFWKSSKSGRWWMQVPVNTRKKHERHRLIPCSWSDYQSACREELPERLLQAFKRF